MDDMAWAAMVKEEVQYQLNYADKYDIISIYILLYYWKSSNEHLVVKVYGLHVIGYDSVEAGDVKFYYPDALELYILWEVT